MREHAVEPLVAPPRRVCEVVGHRVQHGACARVRATASRARDSIEVRTDGLQLERRVVAFDVEQLGERAAERLAGLGEPDRVDVGADEVLVGEVELRRRDLAGDHPLRAAEEVLVVAVAARAERVDQRGLAAAAGAAGALRVVRRRRRDVAQVDDVQRRDVDAELHRRRAEQHRAARPCGSAPRVPRAPRGAPGRCARALRCPARLRASSR